MSQRFALDELHRDVRPAIVLADFVNREDVWMVQRRGRACFLKETTPSILLRDVLRWEQFQRDDALELVVVSFVDGAHATCTDGFKDTVVRNSFCGEGFHAQVLDYTAILPNKNQGRRIVVS